MQSCYGLRVYQSLKNWHVAFVVTCRPQSAFVEATYKSRSHAQLNFSVLGSKQPFPTKPTCKWPKPTQISLSFFLSSKNHLTCPLHKLTAVLCCNKYIYTHTHILCVLLFEIIYESYCIILVNFYIYLWYFSNFFFNFSKINGSQIDLK